MLEPAMVVVIMTTELSKIMPHLKAILQLPEALLLLLPHLLPSSVLGQRLLDEAGHLTLAGVLLSSYQEPAGEYSNTCTSRVSIRRTREKKKK